MATTVLLSFALTGAGEIQDCFVKKDTFHCNVDNIQELLFEFLPRAMGPGALPIVAIGHLLAFPALLIYLIASIHLWKRRRASAWTLVLLGAAIAATNGIIVSSFLKELGGAAMVVMFSACGAITGLLHFFALTFKASESNSE